jgi:hypothetical protein
MKNHLFICALLLLGAHSQVSYSFQVQTNGGVCGNPSAPCSHTKWKFSANDLSFKLPRTLKWQTNYQSAPFYAVILKSRRAIPARNVDDRCGGYFSENERSMAQRQFPNNKVFTSRFGCEVLGVGYTNVNHNYNLLAVYAGDTERDASTFLRTVKAKGYYDANIRRMQVVLSYGD